MVKPGALPAILEMAEIDPLGCVGAFHTCPLHTSEVDVILDGKPPSLRIFPTLDGDFVFRCAHCGFVGMTLEFLARKWKRSVDAISEQLWEDGLLERRYTATEVSNAGLRMEINGAFTLSGLLAYQKTVESRKRPAVYGDFGVV